MKKELNVFNYGQLPWKPRFWFANIANFFKNFKRAKDRITKGYCDYDLYNVDTWLLELIPEALKDFKNDTINFPVDYETMDEWKKEIDKIINCFETARHYDKFSDVENPYEEAYVKLLRDKYDAVMNSKNSEIKSEPLTPEEEELQKNYEAEEKKHRQIYKDNLKEGFELLHKNFGDLWW